jgi:hypothetical protein
MVKVTFDNEQNDPQRMNADDSNTGTMTKFLLNHSFIKDSNQVRLVQIGIIIVSLLITAVIVIDLPDNSSDVTDSNSVQPEQSSNGNMLPPPPSN